MLGRAVHKAIELGFQAQDPFDVFNQYWLSESKTVTDNSNLGKLYNEGIKMIDLYDFNQAPPIEMELGFNLPFPNAENPICNVVGYFDQVFASDKLVDMKTSVQRPKLNVLRFNVQFVIYAWAYEKLYGKLPKIYWHHLRTGELFLADIDAEQIKSIEPIIRGLVAHTDYTQEIEHYHRNVGLECNFCSFAEICLGVG